MKYKCVINGCLKETTGQLLCEEHRKKTCRMFGCQESTITNMCELHTAEDKAKRNKDRSAYERAKPGGDLYRLPRWMRMRAAFKRKYVLCAMNNLFDRPVAADDIDHVVRHKGNLSFFFDPANLQYLSKKAHNEKSGMERRGIICDYNHNTQFENGRYRAINPYKAYNRGPLEMLLIRWENINGQESREHSQSKG